ncbi:DUF3553 domain-containing protein [Dongia rigui]|uniref:DUF3553 domain-containing protein n=1 Tax=Dongia rigui TaxID=940149 RepID=A0ABU5DTD2_9PROT|nr:DUF3553 domain-containing protein [Dongia rigui]MDY0870580.1 DUF3553 domain-containing protein [Dongia rigui]
MSESTDPATLAPGGFVRNPNCPEWGLGRVQSVVGSRVTVNFEEVGKVVLDLAAASLETVEPDR